MFNVVVLVRTIRERAGSNCRKNDRGQELLEMKVMNMTINREEVRGSLINMEFGKVAELDGIAVVFHRARGDIVD